MCDLTHFFVTWLILADSTQSFSVICFSIHVELCQCMCTLTKMQFFHCFVRINAMYTQIHIFFHLFFLRSCTLAKHCNILQHTATHLFEPLQVSLGKHFERSCTLATHCNTLQHAATRCNTLQHTATHCNTLQHTATHLLELLQVSLGKHFERSATLVTHCNTLQHAATHCNTPQHTFLSCCKYFWASTERSCAFARETCFLRASFSITLRYFAAMALRSACGCATNVCNHNGMYI